MLRCEIIALSSNKLHSALAMPLDALAGHPEWSLVIVQPWLNFTSGVSAPFYSHHVRSHGAFVQLSTVCNPAYWV